MSDKVKQVPLTNKEINIIVHLLRKSVPSQDSQKLVVDVVERLEMLLRLQ